MEVMESNMIKAMKGWFKDNQPLLNKNGVVFDIKQDENANAQIQSKTVEFRYRDFVGNVTAWSNGSCDINVVSLESGTDILVERGDFESEGDLEEFLNNKLTILFE